MHTMKHDQRKRRCPLLGHEVHFSYCRAPAQADPCRKILDCWWETFDIREFISAEYGSEMITRLQAPPPTKTSTLVDLIRQAQERTRTQK